MAVKYCKDVTLLINGKPVTPWATPRCYICEKETYRQVCYPDGFSGTLCRECDRIEITYEHDIKDINEIQYPVETIHVQDVFYNIITNELKLVDFLFDSNASNFKPIIEGPAIYLGRL